jgi:hypothetical protein
MIGNATDPRADHRLTAGSHRRSFEGRLQGGNRTAGTPITIGNNSSQDIGDNINTAADQATMEPQTNTPPKEKDIGTPIATANGSNLCKADNSNTEAYQATMGPHIHTPPEETDIGAGISCYGSWIFRYFVFNLAFC